MASKKLIFLVALFIILVFKVVHVFSMDDFEFLEGDNSPALKAHGDRVVDEDDDYFERELLTYEDNNDVPVLHRLAMEDNLPLAKWLVKNGKSVHELDYRGSLALANAQSIDFVNVLCEAGCDPNHKDENGWTALHHAAYQGNSDVVLGLLPHGASLRIANADGQIPVALAGNDTTLRLLLCMGSPTMVVDHQDNTLIHAIFCNKRKSEILAMLETLLNAGLPTYKKNKNGETPLHLLCRQLAYDYRDSQLLKCALMLSSNSCGVYLKNNAGQTAIDILHQGLLRTVNVSLAILLNFLKSNEKKLKTRFDGVLQPGPFVEYPDSDAAQKELEDSVNYQIDGGYTLLMAAVAKHDQTLMSYLIQLGADTTIADDEGKTMYDIIGDRRSFDLQKPLAEALELKIKRRRIDQKKMLHAYRRMRERISVALAQGY